MVLTEIDRSLWYNYRYINMFKLNRVYYGWWIVIAGGLIVGWIGGVGLLGYGAFISDLEKVFGWNKAQLSLAATISTLLAGISSPIIGWAIDKYGPKKLIWVGVLWMGFSLMMFSRITKLWALYLIWPLGISVGTHIAEYAPNASAVAKWFIRYRGRALGFLSGIGGIVAVGIPALIISMMNWYGWQETALILGGVTIVYGLLLAQVHRSESPEVYGLHPDGIDPASRTVKEEAIIQRLEAAWEFTLKEAVRTRSFWFLGLGNLLSGPAFSALMIFLIPIISEKGVTFQAASVGWVAFYAGAIPARFIMAPLEGKFEIRLVNSATTIAEAIGFVFIVWANSALAMYLVLWFIGLGVGAKTPISMSIIANYFGRINYAVIRGWSSIPQTLGSAAGPLILGWLFVKTGGFNEGLLLVAACTALGGVLLYFSKKPQAPVSDYRPN